MILNDKKRYLFWPTLSNVGLWKSFFIIFYHWNPPVWSLRVSYFCFYSDLLCVLDDSELIWEKNRFFGRNSRLWLTAAGTRYVQWTCPLDCSFSTCRWTTVPCHLVVALLVWLQWSTKVAISSEKREFCDLGHIWAWPLSGTFGISSFKLCQDTFPMIGLMYLAP